MSSSLPGKIADCQQQTIGEFSARHNVTLRTIRFYEGVGLLNPTRIGMQRYFSSKDSVRMELTLTAKRLGFSLREIRELIDAHVRRAHEDPQDIGEIVDADKMRRQLDILEKQRSELELAITQLRETPQLSP